MKVLAWYIDPNGIQNKIPSNSHTLLVWYQKRQYRANTGSFLLRPLFTKPCKALPPLYPT